MTSDPNDRRARRAAARAEARRAAPNRSSRAPRWLLPGLIAAAVVAAAVLAVVLPGSRPSGSSSTPPPSAAGAASGSAIAAEPVITGTSLPEFLGPTGDAAVGRAAPEIEGVDFAGMPVAIKADGRPKVVLFLAHWCPHCQQEVKRVQAWINDRGVPDGVDLVAVPTAIDPAAPNYPPDAWLAREGWTKPVLVDPTGTVGTAYGMSAFPFWVIIGPDGTVQGRTVGDMDFADLEAQLRALLPSARAAACVSPQPSGRRRC